MKIRDSAKIIKTNNNGASVIAVIVVTALIGLFVASVMFTSLYNTQMRAAELVTQDTFYTADNAMEEIRVGLTQYTSKAMTEANVKVLENYTVSSDIDATKAEFSNYFLEKLIAMLGEGGVSTATRYDAGKMQALTSVNKGELVISSDITQGQNLYRADDDSSLTLRGVEVYYKDVNDYVSVISTDITISVPEYGFATDANLPDLARFSLIGQKGVVVLGDNVSVRGTSVFAGNGSDDTGGYGLAIWNTGKLSLINCPYVVSESTVNVASTRGFMNDEKKININPSVGKAELNVSPGSSIWADRINLYGTESKLTLEGNSYVNDDLVVYGKNNELTIGGQYFGFGQIDNNTNDNDAVEGSSGKKNSTSAILVNGVDTAIDMSALKTLVLTGNASIGISADAWGSTPGTEKKHVAMGESIAAKGGQLAYLAPPEMVGFNTESKTALGMNPIPGTIVEDFEEVIAEGKGLWINLDRELPTVEGKFLADYGVTSGNEVYVYHDTVSNYAYVYLRFPDEKKAGEFFRDYYKDNFERMTAYIGKYISINELNMFDPDSTGDFRVDVAGNLFIKGNPNEYGMEAFEVVDGYSKGDRKFGETEEITAARKDELNEYAGIYNNLCHKLTTAQITQDESKRTVFENYINQSKLSTLQKQNFQGYFYTTIYDEDAEGNLSNPRSVPVARVNVADKWGDVHVFDGDKGMNSETVKIIVTSNDVYVHKSFDGIIISQGTIYLKPNVVITNTGNELSQYLKATAVIEGIPENEKTGTGNEFQLAELFNEDKNWKPVITNRNKPEEEELDPMEMITFTNWMRN